MLNASKFGRGQLDIYKDTLIIEVPKKPQLQICIQKNTEKYPKKIDISHFIDNIIHWQSLEKREQQFNCIGDEKKWTHTVVVFSPPPFQRGNRQEKSQGRNRKIKTFQILRFQHVNFFISLKYIFFKFTRIATGVFFYLKMVYLHTFSVGFFFSESSGHRWKKRQKPCKCLSKHLNYIIDKEQVYKQ